MSAAVRMFTLAPSMSHIPTFSDHELPLGWQRCAVCHQLIDLFRWLRPCPGPRTHEPIGGM